MFFAPLIGWRRVEVTDQRTQLDYAQQMKYLVDHCFPNAVKIRVVQDNLNTHVPAALYKAFPAPEARQILNQLAFHYTPKHGSWLDMAEIELRGSSGLSKSLTCRGFKGCSRKATTYRFILEFSSAKNSSVDKSAGIKFTFRILTCPLANNFSLRHTEDAFGFETSLYISKASV